MILLLNDLFKSKFIINKVDKKKWNQVLVLSLRYSKKNPKLKRSNPKMKSKNKEDGTKNKT